MTTEEDFQAAFDASPEDWHARLVFADFLQERGDPRAEGYRALGVNRKTCCDGSGQRPDHSDVQWKPRSPGLWWELGLEFGPASSAPSCWFLPGDWFAVLSDRGPSSPASEIYANRRAGEDAAALAFSKLPPARRAELLSTVPS